MVADALPEAIARALRDSPREWLQSACELRLRASGATLCAPGAMRRLCDVGEDGMRAAMASLTRGNMHALGECVRQGYVPLPGGFRAGICGRAIMRGGEVAGLEDVSGICIRITRMLPGASDGVMRHILHAGRARGALIVSAPGLGKTAQPVARGLKRGGRGRTGRTGRRRAGSGRAYRRDEPVPQGAGAGYAGACTSTGRTHNG